MKKAGVARPGRAWLGTCGVGEEKLGGWANAGVD